MFRSSVRTHVNPKMAQALLDLNASPRRRAAAQKKVEGISREVITIAEKLARQDLKERPDDRRRNPSLPRYVDSFHAGAATLDARGRVRAGFGNDAKTEDGHSLALIIEYGTEPHPISKGPPGRLAFPWDPPHSHSQPGGPQGDWPVDFTDDNATFFTTVDHPGQAGFHIMRRAREMWKAKQRGR